MGKNGNTATDKNGLFTIPCGTPFIVISYPGYESVNWAIKNCSDEIGISLEPISHVMNAVEITATSNPTKSILYQPQSINKLGTLELKRGTGLYLDDVINGNVPGVLMERRSVSGGQQIDIRGYGSGTRGTNGTNSNFDIQGVKVYLNGIPLTDAEGITILDDVDFGSIGNAEVTKGPAGTLYGLAIAGVVNLKTIRPERGKTSVGQEVMTGSYGLRRYTTSFMMGGEHASLLANYGYQESDGYMVHTASHKRFVNLAGDFQINNKQSISTYFGYSDSYDERGGELTIDQYNNHDYSGNPAYIKNNAHSGVVSFKAGLSHIYSFNSHISNTTTVYGTGVSNNSSSAAGWTDKSPINYGLRSTIDMAFPLSGNISLSGITGVETQHQLAQTIGYAMVSDPANPNGYNVIGTTRNNQFTTDGTTSVFTEWSLTFPHDLSFTAGVGMSNMHIELNDRLYVAGKPTNFAKTYDGMVSPNFAVNKVFSKELSLYASYSKGYKAPVSSYFFIPYIANTPGTGTINDHLKPEIGEQIEVGSKGSLLNDRLIYQLALFHLHFRDKMTSVAVTSGNTTLYSYVVNGGEQLHKGIEALVKYNVYQSTRGFFSLISPFANLTYIKAEYQDFPYQGKNFNGYDVAGVAPVTANGGVDIFTNPGLYFNALYSYRDAMPITSDNTQKTASFGLLNAKLGYRHSITNHFNLNAYFGANNITGTKYYNMVFINQLPDAYIPGPDKINFFGGINLQYNL
jgi:iron complex outermembrane receptor protein